ncbi:MAG: DUF5916 domain-containing protein [Pseudomonadota bacterium]
MSCHRSIEQATRRVVRAGIIALAVFSAAFAQAQEFWVGLASFQGETNAEKYLSQRDHLDVPNLKIVRAQTPLGTFFRVVSGPYLDESQARRKISEVKSDGGTAWLVLRQTSDPIPTIHDDLAASPTLEPASAAQISLPEVPAQPATPEEIPDLADSLTLEVSAGETIPLTRIEHGAIQVDGHINEAIWQSIPVIDRFVLIEPATLKEGRHKSRMRVAYSDKGIYVSADLEQPQETLLRRLTGRDVRDNRDSFSVTLDTSGEGRYGFWFGINLGDSLMDGTVLPERKFSSDWDGPWYGRSQKTDTGWSMEMYIPWGIVSMPAADEIRQVGMYVSRKVAYLDERWAWPALPSTQPKFMSALSKLEMTDVQPKQQYNIYPFLSSGYDWVDEEARYRAGADMFWRPSTNFQMNATINPDFGNVESDDVIINLTATETFFPEKRLFFLEGQEIFVASPRADTRSNGVGNQGLPYTMVNTRRIGGRPRAPQVDPGVDVPQRELIQPSELKGAVKTTGQIGRIRYGVMGAFEEEVKFDVVDNGTPRNLHQDGNDYGIARLLYEDNEGGAYRALGVLSTAVLNRERDAVVHGVDWHYLSPGGGVKIDGQAMSSDIDGVERGYGGFLDFEFTYREGLTHRVGLEYFDEQIDINDLGFLQRNDEYRIRSALQWTKSDLSWARDNQFDVRGFLQNNVSEDLFTGGGLFVSNRLRLNNLSQLVARLSFFPSVYDDLNSFGNGTYRIEDKIMADVSWTSDTAKTWSYKFGAVYAEENLGAPSYEGSFGITWRPGDQFALELSNRYVKSEGWLLHQQDDLFATFRSELWAPRISIEYFLSARQQFRIAMQWVGIRAREDEFFLVPASPGHLIPTTKPSGPGVRDSYDFSVSQYSLQLRYRWEIAPLSDIFVVYTRQANLGLALSDEDFFEIFDSAWRDPLADFLVFKIRYRFGS